MDRCWYHPILNIDMKHRFYRNRNINDRAWRPWFVQRTISMVTSEWWIVNVKANNGVVPNHGSKGRLPGWSNSPTPTVAAVNAGNQPSCDLRGSANTQTGWAWAIFMSYNRFDKLNPHMITSSFMDQSLTIILKNGLTRSPILIWLPHHVSSCFTNSLVTGVQKWCPISCHGFHLVITLWVGSGVARRTGQTQLLLGAQLDPWTGTPRLRMIPMMSNKLATWSVGCAPFLARGKAWSCSVGYQEENMGMRVVNKNG